MSEDTSEEEPITEADLRRALDAQHLIWLEDQKKIERLQADLNDIIGRFRATEYEPPFDGKPCPMCAHQVRNLAAVAHNLLSAYDAADWSKVRIKIDDLRRAVNTVESLGVAHFADQRHSQRPPISAGGTDDHRY